MFSSADPRQFHLQAQTFELGVLNSGRGPVATDNLASSLAFHRNAEAIIDIKIANLQRKKEGHKNRIILLQRQHTSNMRRQYRINSVNKQIYDGRMRQDELKRANQALSMKKRRIERDEDSDEDEYSGYDQRFYQEADGYGFVDNEAEEDNSQQDCPQPQQSAPMPFLQGLGVSLSEDVPVVQHSLAPTTSDSKDGDENEYEFKEREEKHNSPSLSPTALLSDSLSEFSMEPMPQSKTKKVVKKENKKPPIFKVKKGKAIKINTATG